MAMSALASTISMLASADEKNGQLSCRSCSAAISTPPVADRRAEAVPAGQHGAALGHENTQGMARRPPMLRVAWREVGRLPMFRSAISLIGVAP